MMLSVFRKEAVDKEIVLTESGADRDRGRDYFMDRPLETAINVALTINRPLFITGEPGCGKTELGYAIARKLPGIDNVFLFTVKSNSDARDLFYQFDALARFHAVQVGALRARTDEIAEGTGGTPLLQSSATDDINPLRFLRYRALGRAILMSYGRSAVRHLLHDSEQIPEQPTRSVVIIDEIDKATQDFANDLLFELDQYRFEIPELSVAQRVAGTPEGKPAPDKLPIIVVTANSEKLPPAFLRRCVFHDIQMDPGRDEERFRSIVLSKLRRNRVTDDRADAAMTLAIKVFIRAREVNIEPKVSIAELLDAAFVITANLQSETSIQSVTAELREAVVKALVKSRSGQEQLLADRHSDMWRFS